MKVSPLGDLIIRAMREKGLTREQVVQLVGYYYLPKGLQMLYDLISGEAVAYKHTPMVKLPEVLGVTREEFDTTLAQRAFHPYLWIRTSRTCPEQIWVVAFVGEAAFKYIPLPEGLVSSDGSLDAKALVEIIRTHYRERRGKIQPFGDIVSYILHRNQDDLGTEFSPDGSLLSCDPQPLPQGDYMLKVGKKKITKGLLGRDGTLRS